MANASAHIPDVSRLWESINTKAKTEHDGKVSAYVRAAIERDIAASSAAPDALSPKILVDLCAVRRPRIRAKLAGDAVPALSRAGDGSGRAGVFRDHAVTVGAGLASSSAARNSDSVGITFGGSAMSA